MDEIISTPPCETCGSYGVLDGLEPCPADCTKSREVMAQLCNNEHGPDGLIECWAPGGPCPEGQTVCECCGPCYQCRPGEHPTESEGGSVTEYEVLDLIYESLLAGIESKDLYDVRDDLPRAEFYIKVRGGCWRILAEPHRHGERGDA